MLPKDLKIGMRAVTLTRPWPWTIANGRIRLLGARHRLPAHLIGECIAIHAGPDWDPEANELVRERSPSPERQEDHLQGIVAVAKVKGQATTPDDPWVVTAGLQWWFRGPVTWTFEEVVPIEPVPCAGARDPEFRGLWRVPDETVELLRARIKRETVEWGANAFERAALAIRNEAVVQAQGKR